MRTKMTIKLSLSPKSWILNDGFAKKSVIFSLPFFVPFSFMRDNNIRNTTYFIYREKGAGIMFPWIVGIIVFCLFAAYGHVRED